MTPKLELYPHQREAVNQLDNGKVLCGDVGLGKTLASLTYYVERESPRDIYVITTAKKRDSLDWQDDARLLHIYTEERGEHGVLTVDSWNQIDKYVDVEDAFFVFDEQRLVGNGVWVDAFLKIARRNRWILLSATPGDTWLDYIPVFLANGFYRTRTEFKREHVVYNHHARFPKVDRYLGVNKLTRLKNQLLVDMPYERHTTRHSKIVTTSYDKDLFEKVMVKRWHVYEERPIRDVAELFSVMRKVVNSDASRLTALASLLEDHPRLIVFYNFDYELEMLRTLAQDGAAGRTGYTVAQNAAPSSGSVQFPNSAHSAEHPSQKSGKSRSTEEEGTESWPTDKSRPTTSTSTSTDGGGTSTTSSERSSERSESERSERRTPDSSSRKERWASTKLGGDSVTQQCPLQKEVTLDPTSSTTLMSTGTKLSSDCHAPPAHHSRISSSSDTEISRSQHGGSSGSRSGPTLPLSSSPSSSGSSGTTQSPSNPSRVGSSRSVGTDGTTSAKSTTGVSMSQKDSHGVVIAEWNGHKHEPIPETERWVYLVQYAAGSEGWNCISTNAVVMFSLTYSYKQWHQAHGRIDRLNTLYTDLYYYYLMSDSVIDKAVLQSLNEKKTFNERNFARKRHF